MADDATESSLHVLLIDGLNIVRRVHAGVPGDKESDTHFESMKNILLASLRKGLRRHQPTHVAVVFDGEGESWRKERYPPYKAGRTPMPERLSKGLNDIERAISNDGMTVIRVDGYEADDTIATMAVAIAKKRGHVTVLSSDKHFGQIVGPYIKAFDHFSDQQVDVDRVRERFGVAPDQLATLFALTGDKGVNVAGVKGVGLKTGQRLVQEFNDLDAILDAAKERDDAVGRRLLDETDVAREALQLLSLRLDVPIGVNLRELRIQAHAPR